MSDEDDGHDVRLRAGTFFFVVGIGLLALFFISDVNGLGSPWYFVFGAMLTGLGFWLNVRAAKPPAPSQRFSGIRKINAKIKADKAARDKAKADKAAKKAEKNKKK